MSMASMSLTSSFLLILLLPAPLPANSIPLAQWRTLFSVSHALLTRVANLRAARGDYSGAVRARSIAAKFDGDRGLGFWGGMCSLTWDYAKNYAWRDIILGTPPAEIFGAAKDLNELMGSLNDLTRMESGEKRAKWVLENYRRVLRVSNSLLKKLLAVFTRSGALREVVLILQKEAEEGELIRDCLEVGGNDLKGLVKVAKDILFQHFSNKAASYGNGRYKEDL